MKRVLTVVGFVVAAYAGVVVIRLLAPSNATTLAWMLRTLIFNVYAILLVVAAWFWRSRFPVAWSAVRWFYGVAWTLFGLDFLLDNITRSNPAGIILSGAAVVGGVALLTSLWRESGLNPRGRLESGVVRDRR